MSSTEQTRAALVGSPRIGWTVALSLVFYVVAVAAGIGSDHVRPFWHAKAEDTAQADGDALVSAVQAKAPPLVADKPSGVLLTQAHDCALAGQWDCMSQASDAAQALHGAPATPAAPLASTTPPRHAQAGTVKVAQREHSATHRQVERVVYHPLARPVVRANPDPFFADLYRH